MDTMTLTLSEDERTLIIERRERIAVDLAERIRQIDDLRGPVIRGEMDVVYIDGKGWHLVSDTGLSHPLGDTYLSALSTIDGLIDVMNAAVKIGVRQYVN